jgi:hypothetical protein
MANPLPNAPFRTPAINEQKLFTQQWVNWFTQLFARVGQSNASSLTEIDTEIVAIDTNISALQTTTTTQAGQISAIQTTQTTQAGQITTLQSAVDGLNQEPAP